jgi:hypothetical protein
MMTSSRLSVLVVVVVVAVVVVVEGRARFAELQLLDDAAPVPDRLQLLTLMFAVGNAGGLRVHRGMLDTSSGATVVGFGSPWRERPPLEGARGRELAVDVVVTAAVIAGMVGVGLFAVIARSVSTLAS